MSVETFEREEHVTTTKLVERLLFFCDGPQCDATAERPSLGIFGNAVNTLPPGWTLVATVPADPDAAAAQKHYCSPHCHADGLMP